MVAQRRSRGLTVRVLSLNVKMLPGPFGQKGKDEARAREIARRLGDYDVVCLQELFDEEVREIFTEAVRDQGFEHVVEKLHDDWLHEDSGLFFASRFPISRGGAAQGFEEFEDTAYFSSDSLSDKGIFLARLELPRRKALYVFHTHMQSDESPGQHRDVRDRQFEQIRRFMVRGLQKERSLSRTAAVFLGDFNVIAEETGERRAGAPTSEYLGVLARLGSPRDLYRETYPFKPGYTWDGPGNHRTGRYDRDLQRLDYILALTRVPVASSSSRFRLKRPVVKKIEVETMLSERVPGVKAGPLSDHYGISTVIGI